MSKCDTPGRNIEGGMNIDFMRSLVKQYSELVINYVAFITLNKFLTWIGSPTIYKYKALVTYIHCSR